MKNLISSFPFRVSFFYALFASLWIVISDNLISKIDSSPKLQTYKGWFFVIVTSFLLHLILKKLFSQLVDRNKELQETEKQLFEKSSMLDFIVNNVPQAIFWKDRSSKYLGCNKPFANFAGLKSTKEIIGKTDFDLPWPKGEAEAYIKDDKEVLSSKKAKKNIEEPLQTSSGKRLVINTTKIPLFDNSNNIIGVLGVFDDITNKKIEEQALKESESRYRMLFESNPHSMWVYDKHSFKFLAVNDAAVEKYGYSKNEFLEKTIKDIRPKEDINELLEYVAKRNPLKIDSGIWRHKTKSGKIIHVEIHSHTILFEKKEARLVLANDVSERLAAEQKLIESEYRHRTTLENMAEGYQIIGHDWKYIYVNDSVCRQAKKTREELVGFTMMEKFPGIEKTGMFSVLKSCMNNRVSKIIENRFQFADGSSGWFQLSIQPVPEGIFILSLDISERKDAEKQILELNSELERRVKERTKQLENINKELEAFTYSVSHDLRSPLRAIDGFSKILLEDYESKIDDEGKRLLAVIRNNTKHMDLLITDLLSLSRVTKSKLNLTKIDMYKLVKNIFDELLTEDQKHKTKVLMNDLPDCYGDSGLIQQVWHNLISNALKYSSPKDKVVIEVNGSVEKETLSYHIKDNGVGFNPGYSHKLFGVFQRLHSNSEFDGTGVGLAIVERIVHMHNGKVWGEGKINEGATFHFSLPIEGGNYEL